MTITPPPARTGPAAAAVLAAGLGCLSVGVFAMIADGWHAAARALDFYAPTGPLSGVSTLAILAWLVIWAALARVWGKRDVDLRLVSALAFAAMGLGLVLTFPPFMDLVLGKG